MNTPSTLNGSNRFLFGIACISLLVFLGALGFIIRKQDKTDEWATIMHNGVSISYPKNLSVTTYLDKDTSGQTNLRISSSAVRKVGVDSTSFHGYELVMRQMNNQQYSENRKEETSNPRVSSIVEMCDGSTCPDAQYIFVKNGKRYLIEVLYQPYQAGINLNDRVIASIK